MPSPTKSWTVVLFTEEHTVEAVPSRWINGDTCLWPIVPMDKLQSHLRNCDYNSCWPSLPVKVFRNATYDNFCVARSKAQKAEATSELNTDDDDDNGEFRVSKRKPKKRIISSSDSDEESILTPKKRKVVKKLPKAPVWEESTSIAEDKSETEDVTRQDLAVDFSEGANDGDPQTSKSISNTPQIETGNKSFTPNAQMQSSNLHSKIDKIATSRVEGATPTITYNILEKSNIVFPMTEEETLGTFEHFISSSPENFTELVLYFQHQGGGNIYEFVRRCIAPVMADELCSRFSFTGKKGKREFGKLKLAKAVIDAAQKIGISNNRKEIEVKMGDWLRRAPTRNKNSDKNTVA